MYGYEELHELTPEHILQKVPQEKIFEWVLDKPFDFSCRYISPFRDDKGPHCRFEQRQDGTIVFVDFGDDKKTHRNCFGMVMDMPLITGGNSITLGQAVDAIINHFNLPKDLDSYTDVATKTHTYSKSREKDTSVNSELIITYDKRPYDKRDTHYFGKYLIKAEHLEEDNVFPSSRFYLQYPNKPRKAISVFGLCYAIDFISRVKIYQPYGGDYKWITNCYEDNIGNFNNLPPTGDELIITKSYKDHRFLRNLEQGYNVVWLQNEGCVPSEHILRNLLSRFKLITIFFDNDATGLQASAKIYNILNGYRIASTRRIWLPIECGFKDPSDYGAKEGRKDAIKLLKQIGL